MAARTSSATAGGSAEPAASALADRYDALFVDLDGVVYRGDQALPGVAETIAELHEREVPLLFITNNSSKTPDQVAAALRTLGVPADPREVLTSALATASMLRREGLAGSSAFVIGEDGVRQALADEGIRLLDGDPDRADLVVVGWDRSVDYPKLRTAALLVQRGARLVATNADASYPAPDGLWPGAGSLLAAVTTATGATPTVVGKPERPLFDAAAELTGASNPLVVGDRLETDIAGAAAMGWDSLLVLTGAATPADVAVTEWLPTYIGKGLPAVLEDLPVGRFRVAEPDDGPRIGTLLRGAGLSSDGIDERLEGTVLCDLRSEGSGGTAATASMVALDGYGLLRSVAVDGSLRGAGLGILTVAAALRLGRDRGIREFFLFTETAEPFFSRLGFSEVGRDALPAAVATSPQALEECAVSATAMRLGP